MASGKMEGKGSGWVGLLGVFLALVALGGILHQWKLVAASDTPRRLTIVSAADHLRSTPLAPDSLATAYGDRLAIQTATASWQPLPTSLGGTTVRVGGVVAPLLYVSPGQVNFQIPAGLPAGEATVTITAGDGTVSETVTRLAPVSPGLFAADFRNKVPVGTALRFRNGVLIGEQPLFGVESGTDPAAIPRFFPARIDPGDPGDEIYLVLFGTGIRGRGKQEDVNVLLGGITTPVIYADDQKAFAGLDQINVKLPNSLIGLGRLELAVSVRTDGPDGVVLSNSLMIDMGSRRGLSPPQIISLPGEVVAAGSAVIVNGNGFASRPEENVLKIGSSVAQVERATSTQLVVRIPYGVETGLVRLQTPNGEATSIDKIKVRTSLSGLVRSTENEPIRNLRVELVDTKLNFVKTDQNGFFIFPSLEEGDYKIRYNSEASVPPLPYPNIITAKIFVQEGRDTHYQRTSLQKNSGKSYQAAGTTQPAVLSDASTRSSVALEEQGIVFEFQGDAAFTFPGGGTSGTLTLSRIKESLTPIPLPPQRFSQVVAQITSIGAKLNPGGRLIFPNLDGYLPGESVGLYRLEQDLINRDVGTFVRVGTATVSPDGGRIVTAQNAIREASIYLVSNPRPTTTVQGRVVSQGDNLSVRQAQVRTRGQQTLTDGNGNFLLRDVQAGINDLLSIEALHVRADGSIARTQQSGVPSVPGGITNLLAPLVLQLENGNRSPVIIIEESSIRMNPGKTHEIEVLVYDPDGETPDLSVTPKRSWIELEKQAEGRWILVLAPSPSEGGRYFFELVANDRFSEPTVRNLIVQINGSPVGQTFQTDLATEHNTPMSFTLSGTDPDNDPLSFKIVTQPNHGILSGNAPYLTYTPRRGWSGRDRFTFVVNDGLTNSSEVGVNLVTMANKKPILSVPEAQRVLPGQDLKFKIFADDPAAGQTLTFEINGALPSGSKFTDTGNRSAQFTWVPTGRQTGSYELTFVVKDDGTPQMWDEKRVIITVINRSPVLVVPAVQTVLVGQSLSFTVTASDPDDGQSLSFRTLGSRPTGATFDTLSGRFVWTPTAAQTGDYKINFIVEDDGKPVQSDAKAVDIKVQVNRPPVLTVPGSQTAKVGDQLTLAISAVDPNSGQLLTYGVTGNLPTGASIDSITGRFHWVPTTSQVGDYTISFIVTDNGAPPLTTTEKILIRVIPAYKIHSFTTAIVNENGQVTKFAGRPTLQFEEDLGEKVKLEMVAIPGGIFTMGSPESEAGRFNHEGPQRMVTVAGFVLGKYEIMEIQWRQLMGVSRFDNSGDFYPVKNVTWDEAKEFCRRLNIKFGLTGAYGYRLPTEAEWEYAAKAGTTTPFAFGITVNSDIVNYSGDSPYGAAPPGVVRRNATEVGALGVANGWGIYDMHGNVSEWCEDDYHVSYQGGPPSGIAWVDVPRALLRILRGGDWFSRAVYTRSAQRFAVSPSPVYFGTGFRVARTFPIEITVPNRTPFLSVPGSQVVNAGQLLNFSVIATDVDQNQTLLITHGNLPQNAKFNLSSATNGQFTWTPTATQTGDYTLTFMVTDDGFPALSETKTVKITVINRQPALILPTVQTAKVGEQLIFTVSATDPDEGQTLTITTPDVNLPTGATLTQGGSVIEFKWTPTTAQIGSYTVNFMVTDNGVPVQRVNGTVVIKVTPAFVTKSFMTASISTTGLVTRFEGGPVQQYEEQLGGGVKLEMVVIPGGSFTMGSPDNEAGRFADEGPQRLVSIREFVIGKYEVTQLQWNTVMGISLPSFRGDNLPIKNVTYDDVQEFCQRLNLKLGLRGMYRYRLPTEAEWEYAARAGTTSQYAFGTTISSEIVNYNGLLPYGLGQVGIFRSNTVEVGSLGAANKWGLFDMHGNVSEWCEDDWHDNYQGGPTDGSAWLDKPRGTLRVIRGGSWGYEAVLCRSALREGVLPSIPYDDLGFRLVRTLP